MPIADTWLVYDVCVKTGQAKLGAEELEKTRSEVVESGSEGAMKEFAEFAENHNQFDMAKTMFLLAIETAKTSSSSKEVNSACKAGLARIRESERTN